MALDTQCPDAGSLGGARVQRHNGIGIFCKSLWQHSYKSRKIAMTPPRITNSFGPHTKYSSNHCNSSSLGISNMRDVAHPTHLIVFSLFYEKK